MSAPLCQFTITSFSGLCILTRDHFSLKVHLVVDYVQPKPEGSTMDDRVCATVTIGDTNLAEVLVQRGLANVVRYRNPTDARSRAYDALLAAEALAQKKLLGLFDPKPAAVHRFAELDGKYKPSIGENPATSF